MKVDYAAQCRFFTAEDAVRLALQSYYAAGRYLEPPPGEPWMTEDGSPWADAAGFATAFQGQLEARLALMCLDRLGDFDAANTSWNLYKLASDIEPEKMTKIIDDRNRWMADIDADFFGDERNSLPPGNNP
jgi:hypothetical protein